MQDLNDLYYYVQVVDHAGFAAAGRALGIPKSKLSRRIARLEERLGVRLIQRSTRKISVTPVGQNYYAHCKAMLVEAQAAQEVIETTHAEPCGVIRMTCPITLLHVHISAMLADFMARYPGVIVQLEATNRRVDLLAEGVDLALRVRPRPFEDSDLAHRVLSDRGQCLVASPKLAKQYPPARYPFDLSDWPSLARGTPEQSHEWIFSGPNNEKVTQTHSPRLITTDMLALQAAALAGVGIVQLPHLMVDDDLQQGRLIHLLPDWQPRREVIHVVYPTRRGLLPSVRALIDHLVTAYASFEED